MRYVHRHRAGYTAVLTGRVGGQLADVYAHGVRCGRHWYNTTEWPKRWRLDLSKGAR